MAYQGVITHQMLIPQSGKGEIKYMQRLDMMLTTTVEVGGLPAVKLGTQTYPMNPDEPEATFITLKIA